MARESWMIGGALVSLLALACGGGGGERTSTPMRTAASDIAGGQTSEFSGGSIAFCPETLSNTSFALDAPGVAEWVELADGHHELSLGWRKLFAIDTLTGFEEHTRLLLDVNVLGARELVYGAGGSDNYEVSGCEGLRELQLEIEGDLETADGALRGPFRQWLRAERDPAAPGGRRLFTTSLKDESNGSHLLSDFASTLDLGIEVAATDSQYLVLGLGFDGESAHGYLGPSLLRAGPANEPPSVWSPVEGTFPDVGCGSNLLTRALPLDETSAVLGETPRAAFERFASSGPATFEAAWQQPGRGEEPPRVLSQTEVELRLGSAEHACILGDTVSVHTSVAVVTADGVVNLTQPGVLGLQRGRGPGVGFESVWIPNAHFEAATGMRGVELGSGEYGALRLHHDDNGDGEFEGSLRVQKWQNFELQLSEQPELKWCGGEDCGFFWCRLTTSNPSACPSSI